MKNTSGDSIVITELETKDREKVQHLLVESYRQYGQHFTLEEWTDYVNALVSSIDNSNANLILVAKDGEEVLGSLQVFESSEKAYDLPELQIFSPIIRMLAVHPNARNRGVAQKLLKEVIRRAAVQGAESIYLHTPDFMSEAKRLYEKFGFKQDLSKELTGDKDTVRCYRYDL